MSTFKHTLSFPMDIEVDPVLSTLNKNSDGTWNVQLKLNGTLRLKSLESLEVSEEKLHHMMHTDQAQIKLL